MPPKKIVIVGGGITGLSAALQIQKKSPDTAITLLESSDQVGGVLNTIQRDGYLVERAADMFTAKLPWARQLCDEVGYSDLISVNPEHRQAFLVRNGKLLPVPHGFSLLKPVKLSSMMLSPLLSISGKLRLLGERFVAARKETSDESLESFARRRLGDEVYERIVQPLIGGIYTADPAKLSMQATLPQFPEMERKHGSLIRAAIKDSTESEKLASGARYDQFVAPRQGFRHFIDHLAAQLPTGTIRTGAKTVAVRKKMAADGTHADAAPWEVQLESGEAIATDAVLLATPAPKTVALVDHFDEELGSLLGQIPYAGSCVVVMGCRQDQFQHPLNGFGFVVPVVEQRKILASSFSSIKFAGRAPEGRVLVRTFVGGAIQPELNELDDGALEQLAKDELGSLAGFHGEPEWVQIVRWPGAMPQYHVGHVEVVEKIDQRCLQHPGLELAGSAYKGVGIPFCVRSGQAAADRLCEPTL